MACSIMPLLTLAAPPAVLTPAVVNDASIGLLADATMSTAAVLRAQVLLDRAQFSPGEIDGGFGSNTRAAIAGFQRNRSLPASGELDAATWTALNTDQADVLVTYTLTAEDVAGPFTPIPADMIEKSRLDALGYTSAAEALGERFHASPTLLQRLNPGQDLGRAGATVLVPGVTEAALPIGEWTINGVATNPVFHYNPALFWDGDPSHGKAKIPAGPNNPVGVVWVDLSKPHYGLHGTPEPSKIGKTASHGCIRLTNWSAMALGGAVAPGTPAALQE